MPLHETIQDFPADVCITEVELTCRNAVGVSTSPYTLRRQSQVFPGQRWELRMEILPMDRDQAAALEGFLRSLRGSAGRFRMGDPYSSLPRGSIDGSPTVLSATAGEETLTTQGWTASAAGVLAANDFIQIGDHLYSVIEDADADSSGEAELTLWPALRSSYALNTPIVVENARGVFALRNPTQVFSRSRLEKFGTEIEAVEVL